MGLFSFIGKAIGAVAHALPGVGQLYDVASGIGSLLAHKSGTSGATTGGKMGVLGRFPTAVSRGNPTAILTSRILANARGNSTQSQGQAPVYIPRQVFSETPTMPGGGIATPSGIVPQQTGVPPTFYGRSGFSGGSKRKRSSSSKRSAKKRRGSGRKLKFGSPAWRKKYMKKSRRR